MSFPLHSPFIPLRPQKNEVVESFGDRGPIILDIPGSKNELLMAGICTTAIPKLYPIVGLRKELPGIALPAPIPLDLPRIDLSRRKVEKIESNIQATELEHCEELPSKKQTLTTPPCPAPPPRPKKIFDLKESVKNAAHPQGVKPSGSLLEDKKTKKPTIALSTRVFSIKGAEIWPEHASGGGDIASTQIVPVLHSASSKKTPGTEDVKAKTEKAQEQCKETAAIKNTREAIPQKNRDLQINGNCIQQGVTRNDQLRTLQEASILFNDERHTEPVDLLASKAIVCDPGPNWSEAELDAKNIVAIWNHKLTIAPRMVVPAICQKSHWHRDQENIVNFAEQWWHHFAGKLIAAKK